MADVDWGSVDQQLKQKAGQWYDSSMLGDVQRNSSYGAGDSPDMASVNDWVGRVAAKATLRGGNEANSTYRANGAGGTTTGPTGTVNYPTTPTTGSGAQGSGAQGPAYEGYLPSDLVKQMMEQQAAQAVENKSRGDNLFKMYNDRATQSLAIDRNDPIIRAQADAFSANQDRSARNLVSDAAERGGQYANLDGTRRMAAEHAGQASGAFEANLMGQELGARRNEIAQALAGMGGQLTAEQQNQLQRQLALLDHAIKQQQVGLGKDTLAQDWQNTLLRNEQFNSQLGLDAQVAHDAADRAWGK